MNTHTFSTIFACFCERDTTKAATITQWMEKTFEERCEQVYFNHFYWCDEFYSISNVNGLTNNIFFLFFKTHSSIAPCHNQWQERLVFCISIILLDRFMFNIHVCVIWSLWKIWGHFKLIECWTSFLFLSLSLYSSKLVILAHCVYKKGVLQIQKTFG